MGTFRFRVVRPFVRSSAFLFILYFIHRWFLCMRLCNHVRFLKRERQPWRRSATTVRPLLRLLGLIDDRRPRPPRRDTESTLPPSVVRYLL